MIETRYISNNVLFKETSFTHLRFYSLDNPELGTSCYRHFRDFLFFLDKHHSSTTQKSNSKRFRELTAFPVIFFQPFPSHLPTLSSHLGKHSPAIGGGT